MIKLNSESRTKTLYKLLNKWAKRYNPKNRNWRCYTYKLDEISLTLKKGGFNVSQEAELTKNVSYRIKQHHPQLTNNERFVWKIASNVVAELIRRIQSNVTLSKYIFIDLDDYI